MGFSMGGGGVLLAAADMGEDPASVIALAPWLGDNNVNYNGIKVPTMMLGSEEDELAYYTEDFYAQLPSNIERGLAMFAGASHYDWFGSGNQDEKAEFRTLVTAFLEVQLKDDDSASEDSTSGSMCY